MVSQLLLFKLEKVLKKIQPRFKELTPSSPEVPTSSTSPGACASLSLYCNSMVKIVPLSSVGGLTWYLSVSMSLILLLFPSLCSLSTLLKTLLPLLSCQEGTMNASSLYLPVLICLCWWWELKCQMQGYMEQVWAVQHVTLVQQDLSELLYRVINCLPIDVEWLSQ